VLLAIDPAGTVPVGTCRWAARPADPRLHADLSFGVALTGEVRAMFGLREVGGTLAQPQSPHRLPVRAVRWTEGNAELTLDHVRLGRIVRRACRTST
jgi:hypothetical protein